MEMWGELDFDTSADDALDLAARVAHRVQVCLSRLGLSTDEAEVDLGVAEIGRDADPVDRQQEVGGRRDEFGYGGRELAAENLVDELDRRALGARVVDLEHANAGAIDVFFQVSTRPLYTVNREHFISEIIELCGGRNVFADVEGFAPSVSVEAVVDRNPEVMLAGTDLGDAAFEPWTRWPGLSAIRYGNQFLLPDETIGRPSPRLALAARSVCLALEKARINRSMQTE